MNIAGWNIIPGIVVIDDGVADIAMTRHYSSGGDFATVDLQLKGTIGLLSGAQGKIPPSIGGGNGAKARIEVGRCSLTNILTTPC